ncbi:MAG TPA: GNAT family N-acetyltransferase [Acidimicrobiia bacterium]|nr:GNAT family N-acetyltransferase [Acidimicrobiia bacterium]
MSEWSSLLGAEAPLAPLVGPFPEEPFVDVWWRHRAAGVPVVAESDGSVLACVLADGMLRMAGEADLTDYHSPLGSSLSGLVDRLIAAVPPGTRLVLDSLPEEAAVPLAAALSVVGVEVSATEHAATMTLDLPERIDDHMADLAGKHRHEIRRKRRRFEDALGMPGLRRDDSGFNAFVEMHRAAPGDKGLFMTDGMAGFFRDLLATPGWVLDALVGSSGKPVAAAVGFEDDRAYYLYNSSFDPAAAEASPGIVLTDELIRAAIGSGRRRFDFLKGRESYKRRFGAVPRPLTLLEGALP